MAQAVLSVRMDEDVKRAFADFCDQIGMSVSTAFNVFARQTLREGRIPFDISLGKGAEKPAVIQDALDTDAIADAVAKAAAPIPGISKVVLFGSRARGDAGAGSDVDLRVIRADEAPLGLVDIAGFSETVRELTGRPVDVVSSRVIENAALAGAIERDGVTVYER